MGAVFNEGADGEKMSSRWFTQEEMEKLKQNPAVWRVCEATIVLNETVYEQLFNGWHKNGQEFLEELLSKHDLLDVMTDTGYIDAMKQEFRKGIHNRYRGNADNAVNAALVASGSFKMGNSSVKWLPEIRKSLVDQYPDQSFEEGIRKLGLTAEIVGISRINSLKQTVIRELRRKEQADKMLVQASGASNDEIEYIEADAYIYMKHPYVKEVTGKGRITMQDAFFNEAKTLSYLPIEKLLKIYEIDSSLLKGTAVSGIQQELLWWDKTAESQSSVNNQVVRIQTNRMRELMRHSDELFAEIMRMSARATPLQKKELCRQISEYPTQLSFPYGYSMRDILGKAGISKTTYYRALNSDGYGMAEELRRERDARDLKLLMDVVDYKGFEKGIRQIYMMMPELTGEQFAISKIRRLLRSAGIKTKIRGENPARQRAREFHERNTKANLLKREFRLHRPNEVRLTDVTYLDYGRTNDGEKKRAYGSSCIDPVTGKLLAFNISENNDLELALETLGRLSEHPTMIGALLHSDQGILYLTDEFQAKVEEMGMVQSMSKRGNCWDNAPQESFFGHFKDECRYEECETLGQLRAMIDEYAYYYNHERHQWSRNRMTPIKYETYMEAMTDEEFEAYMEAEEAKYANMKKNAEKKAIERAKTLGV